MTRKRCWLDSNGEITTSRPTTPLPAAASASIGPQAGNSQVLSTGKGSAFDMRPDSEASSEGSMSPQSYTSSPSLGGGRSAHNGRPEPEENEASRQFQQRDFRGQEAFEDEDFQLALSPPPEQSYGIDTLIPGTAEMSLADHQVPYGESFSADTASGFDMSFAALNYSRLLEMLPGYFLGDQEQDIAIGAEPTYATDAAGDGDLLEALGLDVRGPMVQQQTYLHQDTQSLAGVLDIPFDGFRTGSTASPNHQPPDLEPPWALPTPSTQYSTTSPASTLDFTLFDECASTPTSPSQPSPTIFAPRLPQIDEASWREVISFITQATTNLVTGEPGLRWGHPLLSLSAMQNYLDLFFSRFNSSYPLLHRPSFDPSSADTLLLVSVLMLGATYGGREARQMAERVHDGLRGVLVGVGFLDPTPTGTWANRYQSTRREDMIYRRIISMLRPSCGCGWRFC